MSKLMVDIKWGKLLDPEAGNDCFNILTWNRPYPTLIRRLRKITKTCWTGNRSRRDLKSTEPRVSADYKWTGLFNVHTLICGGTGTGILLDCGRLIATRVLRIRISPHSKYFAGSGPDLITPIRIWPLFCTENLLYMLYRCQGSYVCISNNCYPSKQHVAESEDGLTWASKNNSKKAR